LKKILRNKRTAVIWFAFLVVLAVRSSGDPASMSCRSDEVFVAGECTQVVHLSSRLVIAATDSVSVGDVYLSRGQDYRVDYAEGIIYLRAAPAPGESILVHYTHLPVDIKPTYCLRQVERNTYVDAEIDHAAPGRTDMQHPYDIRASGSKTICASTNRSTSLSAAR
jgi:hypothetical protein